MKTSFFDLFPFLVGPSPWIGFSWGLALGGMVTGLLSLLAFWLLAKRLQRLRILDHTRLELKGPVIDYIDWLHAISGEFPQWRRDLIPGFQMQSGRDQFELNRMRKLFVDPRSSTWFARLEEYELLLAKFGEVIQKMWRHQAEIGERFHRVLSQVESHSAAASKAAEELEELAFEQSQLAHEFMDHLQYECLKPFAPRKLNSRQSRHNRIRRTAMGNIKIVEPAYFL
jgi:hypothetical protein